MGLIHSILMGLIQGLSEFLPISSSAHLVFTSNFYKIFKGIQITQHSSQEVFLDIMLHFGTLVAVILFFRKEISELVCGFVDGIKAKNYGSIQFKYSVYIILGTLLTVIIAIPFSGVAEKIVFKPVIAGVLLIFTGFLLLFSEYKSKQYKEKHEITNKSSILIGLAQGIAILPGFSRSGLTIAAGLMSGTDRITAARYSFLLSIPIILGASMIYPLWTIDFSEMRNYNWISIIAGTLVSGVVGYLCIKYFLKFVSRFSLGVFGVYCILMGIFSALFFSLYS